MAKNLVDSIQMEIRSKQPCRKELDFVVPAEAVTNETQKVLREFSYSVAVPGFRQGKAPIAMLKAKYANDIRQELVRKIIYAGFELAGKDESLDIVSCGLEGEPKLEFDQEFKFTLGADIAPEFELADYKAIKVDEVLDAVTDEAIDERVKFYRAMYGNYADAADAARKDDMLKVSYKSDFALPENASPNLKRQLEAESTFLWLSDPETLPGCTAALTGAEVGKEYTFKSEYPADYREATIAGKTIEYTLKVEGIQRRAELSDEELAEKARVGSIAEFRDMLRKAMEQENSAKQHSATVEKVYTQIDGAIPEFELPPSILASEVQKELQKMARETVKSEADADKFKAEMEENKKKAEVAAKKSLRRMFILRKIAKLENITLEEGEVDSQLSEMSRYYGYKENEFRAMLEKNGGMDDLQLDILCNKVLNRLAEMAGK
ncbi:MAG: trigger factor [Victivallales bacterium]|jgi:trigger factor|nr:trigger factor [Victivallales bacterium]